MFQNTSGGGMAFAFPDVCKTPAPTGFVPLPYPNLATGTQADPETVALNVLVCGMPALNMASVIAISEGNEAGTGGGVISGEIMGQATFLTGSVKVMIGGVPTTRLTSATAQNGAFPNTEGVVLVPSQTVVLVLS
ncbi:DUF4150 domain-containing protein [Paraburkholderia sediminicola]|uniref:DUF4150 domain-containing protein n=1 Tax=Paraburkholderia sediminicola TaxID=458836 RepID=UPI0038BAD007